jgi:hypothetical protein
MTLKWIDIKRAGPHEEIEGQEAGAASLLIASSTQLHKRDGGPDYLEVCGVLEHCAKIAPRSIGDAEKWIEWLKSWIAEQAGDGKVIIESLSGIGIVTGEPHEARTVLLVAEGCGGYFWAEEWKGRWCLFGCEQGDYEKGGRESDQSFEVSAPEDQAFLDVVNERLFTEFRYEDFSGR